MAHKKARQYLKSGKIFALTYINVLLRSHIFETNRSLITAR
ncbi:hypothetical protein SAMN03084138_03554 [Enterovibrio norvegicus DSM 15893]|uniref:Uncharacterized protein n=1 Tax=Enterovibrio norvegicus DSM 15893 TaxID=1121869 RepID=A0A1I5UBY8_9GAMM|nr:hypothetical protein SAMN03084138_03554 [Enterovibrio norvegicus DSM 15893]